MHPTCPFLVLAAVLPAAEPAALLARLHDPDPKERELAALVLGARGEAAAVAPIAESIVRKIEIGNRDAALALAWIGAPALPRLRELLAHGDPFVRTEALRALQLIEPAPTGEVAAVLPLLRDPNRYVVRNALEFLARCRGAAEPAVAEAARLLADRVSVGRAAATLAAVGAPALPAVRDALQDGARAPGALRALAAMGAAAAPALPDLVALLADERLRAEAAEALSGMGAAAAPALPQLTALLAASDARASAAAAEAIAAIGAAARPAVPALAQAIRRVGAPPTQAWNLEAVDALGSLRDPTAAEALAAVLDDPAAGEARLRALRALVRLDGPPPAARQALLRAASGKDDRLAREALAHAALLPADAATALAANLGRKDAEVACRSAAALLRREPTHAAAGAALAAALRAEGAKDARDRERLRAPALAALALLPEGGWRPELAPLLADPADARAALAALAAAPWLATAEAAAVARHLAAEDVGLRIAAALVAVRAALPETTSALRLLSDEAAAGGTRARAAIQALGRLRERRAEVVPVLRRALRDPDWKVRTEAENALQRIEEETP